MNKTQEGYMNEMLEKIDELSSALIHRELNDKTKLDILYQLGELSSIVKYNHPIEHMQ